MKSDEAVLKQAKAHKASSNSLLGKQREHKRQCDAFYAGDMMDYRDNVELSDTRGRTRKTMVQFNRVKPYVNAVKGFMAQNRRRAKYGARIEGQEAQELYSGYCNAVADYARENADADQVESQQDEDMLVSGVGAIETCMTYGDGYAGSDPNGEILYEPLDDNYFYDPHAIRKNLIDARWAGYDKIYPLDEALDQFDKSKPEDFEDAEPEDQGGIKVDSRTGVNYRVVEGYDWDNEEDRTIKVTFYQWYEIEKLWRCENPLKHAADQALAAQVSFILDTVDVGDFEGFSPQEDILVCDAAIKKQIEDAMGDAVEFFPTKRKAFFTAVYSGDKLFDKYRSISQQGFTIQFKTGDRDKKNKIWTGMVTSMMQPTLYYNKSLTELMLIIAAASKGGVMYEKGAIEDIVKFERNYARTNAAVEVKDGALTNGRIKPKREPYQPSGYENIVGLADAAISEVNGIDKSFLGSSENRDETASLQRRRIRQVVTALASYFDSITLYQKRNGRILLDFLRVLAENNPGAVIRIIGRDGEQEYAQLSADPLRAEFEVTVSEAPQTAEEKQEYAGVLGQIATTLAAAGDIATAKQIYATSIKYTPLDPADKQRLAQILAPQDGQPDPAYVQQLEKQLQQLMSEANKAALAKTASETTLNAAKVKQVQADVQNKAAQTTKALEEAEQLNFETAFTKKHADTATASVNL